MTLKGMLVLTKNEIQVQNYLKKTIKKILNQNGYEEIEFPILEKADLFKKTLGVGIDIIEKELFSFLDKNNIQVALRPEGTAPCLNAAQEKDMLRNKQKKKLWYIGPMFRRENTQKGRYRQFTQIGVEAIGFKEYTTEIEQIAIINRIFKKLNLLDYVHLEINILGSCTTKKKYAKALNIFFTENVSKLDDEDKKKINKNPLRILDSKNEKTKLVVNNAPKITEYLNKKDLKKFDAIKTQLKLLKIKFKVNYRLVRGIDYYQDLVYEWLMYETNKNITICAGGRYDNLVNKITNTTKNFGTGWALGLERLALLLNTVQVKKKNKYTTIFLFFNTNVHKNGRVFIAEAIKKKNKNLIIDTFYENTTENTIIKKAKKKNISYVLKVDYKNLIKKKINILYTKEIKKNTLINITDIKNYIV